MHLLVKTRFYNQDRGKVWFTGERIQHKKEPKKKLQNYGEGRFEDDNCTSGRNRGWQTHSGHKGSEEISVISDTPEHIQEMEVTDEEFKTEFLLSK